MVEGLLALHPFTHLYIADLDAIARSGNHSGALAQLHHAFPALQLWVDAGIGNRNDYLQQLARSPGTAVAGTETLVDTGLLQSSGAGNELVLSLDFRHGWPLGQTDIPARPALWPDRIICMCLDRVGSDRGPDLAQLQRVQRDAPHSRLFAAGGIRHAGDLAQLQAVGVAGALLASALHGGHIGAAQLRQFS